MRKNSNNAYCFRLRTLLEERYAEKKNEDEKISSISGEVKR